MATKKKPTTKTAKPAATPAKPTTKRTKSEGKRYTPEEKAEVLAFVKTVNAERGRGGVTAAVRKFGVTALTISSWIKKAGGTGNTGKAAKVAATDSPKAVGGRAPKQPAEVLYQLVALRDEIGGLEFQLAAKKAQFDRLKALL